MESFFHQEKEWLWRYCLTIDRKPSVFYNAGQAPYGNFLLHGPPGTGKSTLVYRLGMALSRHVVSVDLSCMNKIEAYESIRTPKIMGVRCNVSHCIILLEEFDIAIDKLTKKSVQSPMTRKRNDGASQMACTCEFLGVDDELCISCFARKKEEQEKEESEEVQKMNRNKFTIEDLLELLQGPIPNTQSLIFATTNKYHEIKTKCPALFRPGRLTPVHFDHLNAKSFDDLCLYHFGKTMDAKVPDQETPDQESPRVIPHSTASIISMVMKAKTMHDDNDKAFEYFQEMFCSSISE